MLSFERVFYIKYRLEVPPSFNIETRVYGPVEGLTLAKEYEREIKDYLGVKSTTITVGYQLTMKAEP